jgi:hypothetical protein
MDTHKFFDELTHYHWSELVQLRGNAHNSTIGFISLSWNRVSPNRVALDAPPTYQKHEGQTGNKYADLLLLEDRRVKIAVEVETMVSKYSDKLDTLSAYFNNKKEFPAPVYGLMILLNSTGSKQTYKTNWGQLKQSIEAKNLPVALVSIEKSLDDTFADPKVHPRLLGPSGFLSWRMSKIEAWFPTRGQAKPQQLVLFPTKSLGARAKLSRV